MAPCSLEEQPRLCKTCNALFPSWDALMQHKAAKRKADDRHIHCKCCGMDFNTELAEFRHVQMDHAKEQDLECPGCGKGPFKRLGGLMSHIENKCPRINTSTVEELREKKLEFPRRLEQLTKQPVKENYMKYMPSSQPASPAVTCEVEEKPDPFVFNRNEFPDLSSKGGDEEKNPLWDFDSKWSTGKNLFKEAPAAQHPTEEQLAAATAPNAKTLYQAMDTNHPSHPGFNAALYHNTYTEKFDCPKLGCRKSFKNASGLVGHLRSPAHGNTTYCCPYCHKTFKSLVAITFHAESSGVKCMLRETDNYNAYLDQLTAGLVDVDLGRNEDGTHKYYTTKAAKEKFWSPEMVDKKPKEKKPREEFQEKWEKLEAKEIKW